MSDQETVFYEDRLALHTRCVDQRFPLQQALQLRGEPAAKDVWR
jgi:hypothetical protein